MLKTFFYLIIKSGYVIRKTWDSHTLVAIIFNSHSLLLINSLFKRETCVPQLTYN